MRAPGRGPSSQLTIRSLEKSGIFVQYTCASTCISYACLILPDWNVFARFLSRWKESRRVEDYLTVRALPKVVSQKPQALDEKYSYKDRCFWDFACDIFIC